MPVRLKGPFSSMKSMNTLSRAGYCLIPSADFKPYRKLEIGLYVSELVCTNFQFQ